MATVNKSLDEILFDTPDMQRVYELEALVEREEPIELRAVGGPLECHVRGRVFKFNGTDPVPVTPKMGIELLYYYGREGLYRGRDPLTWHTPDSYARLGEDERHSMRPPVVQTAYLTAEPEPKRAGKKGA